LKLTLAAIALSMATPTLAAATSATPAPTNEQKPIFFGIVPQQSATRLAQIWLPVINELKAKTGLDVRFATTKDIPTFEACLAQGAYDIAYMNPIHYTLFHEAAGYEAFAYEKGKKLTGIMVTRKDSAITSIKDLHGKQIAFPSPAAFGASVLPQAEAQRQGIEIDPVYVKSHDSVYRAVALGLYPAGGGVMRTFNAFPEELRADLNVFYTTKSYTPHAFASHPSLDPAALQSLKSALLAIEDTAILQPLGMKGLAEASNADWDDVRALNLQSTQAQMTATGIDACHSG
jgi:phosphonate transport system substrate-binding protein